MKDITLAPLKISRPMAHPTIAQVDAWAPPSIPWCIGLPLVAGTPNTIPVVMRCGRLVARQLSVSI